MRVAAPDLNQNVSKILAESVKVRPVTLTLPPAHPRQYELINAFDNNPELRFLVGACGTKFGKLLKLKELVATPTGWKQFGDVHVGDYIFGVDGKPTKIIFETPVTYDSVAYRVTFSDGTEITVCKDHLWETETHACRKANGDLNGKSKVTRRRKSTQQAPRVVTTEEIKNTLLVKVGGELRPNHSIRTCEPVEYPEQKLLVDPYILGAWLGDGTSCAGDVTGIDEEIHQYIGMVFDRYMRPSSAAVGQTWSYRGLTSALGCLGVLDNKHVPVQYLIGSVEQRLALLQGLMDTDGTISKRGDCSFYNTNERIADAVAELAASLGIKVNRESRLPKLNGSRIGCNGEKYKKCFIVHFTTDLPVFWLRRKLERIRPVAAKAKRRYITAVTPTASVPMKCIRVDNESHLFLVSRSFIPTHNTWGCTLRLVKEAWDVPNSLNWWVAPTFKQSKMAYHLVMNLLPKGTFQEYKADLRLTLLRPDGSEHSFIEFKSAEDESSLRGFGVKFFVLDEAARCSFASWVSLNTTITQTLGRGIVISTPKGRNWFYDIYQKGDKSGLMPGDIDEWPEWLSIRMPTWTNPHVPLKSIEDMRRNLPEDVFRQEVAAQFLMDSAGVFRGIQDCIKGALEAPIRGHQYVMGVDLARLRDFTVLTVMDRQRRNVVAFDRFTNLDWDVQYRRIIELAKRYSAVVYMDSTGIGDPIVGTISRAVRVEPYKIGGSAAKQQLIDKLRVNIENERVSFPTIAPLVRELQIYEYQISDSGVVKFEAPSGMHDDCVISLALANWGADQAPFIYRHYNQRGI